MSAFIIFLFAVFVTVVASIVYAKRQPGRPAETSAAAEPEIVFPNTTWDPDYFPEINPVDIAYNLYDPLSSRSDD